MKQIRFNPGVAAQVRAVPQQTALRMLRAIHYYAATGEGDVKALTGRFEGLKRLRCGDYRIVFEEGGDTMTIHQVRNRREVYR